MSIGPRRRFGLADGLIPMEGFAAVMGHLRFMLPDITPGDLHTAFNRPTQVWTWRHIAEAVLELG